MLEIGKQSLYGWGVCQIPMPRARKDIYGDRRRSQRPVDFPDRRTSGLLQPFPAVFASILRKDFPAVRTAIVVLASTLLLLAFGLTTRSTPPEIEAPVPEPVEIVTRMLKEPLVEPPVPAEPVVAQELPRPQRQPQPIAVKPPVVKEVPPQPVAVKPPVVKEPPPQPKKIVSLPPAKVQPLPKRVVKPKVQAVEKPVVMPKKTVSLATPQRQAPLLSKPAPSSTVPKYTVPTSEQPRVVTARPVLGRRSAEPLVAARKAAPVADYRLKSGASGQPALVQGNRFAPTAPGTTVDLPDASGRSGDFSMPRSQGGHAVATAGRSFAPKPGHKEMKIAAVGQVAGSYAASSSQVAAPPTSDQVGGFTDAAPSSSIDLPVAPGHSAVSTVASSTGSTAGVAPADSTVNFVGDGEAGADPNLFISLNQLDACVDQSEEDRLRTELAIRLDEGGVFPCGEMKFYIDYVETGQTVQMRIYNPRNFADKCAALLSAIECINHSK